MHNFDVSLLSARTSCWPMSRVDGDLGRHDTHVSMQWHVGLLVSDTEFSFRRFRQQCDWWCRKTMLPLLTVVELFCVLCPICWGFVDIVRNVMTFPAALPWSMCVFHWRVFHVEYYSSNTNSMPRRHRQHFADDIFKRILFNENVWISIKISPRFVPNGPINKYSIIGSDNGLAPSRRQAIIWTNDS